MIEAEFFLFLFGLLGIISIRLVEFCQVFVVLFFDLLVGILNRILVLIFVLKQTIGFVRVIAFAAGTLFAQLFVVLGAMETTLA